MSTPLEKAVNAVGGQSALARALGVKPQAVQQWIKAGHVPPRRVIDVEKATNGEVTRYELAPDIYPSEAA